MNHFETFLLYSFLVCHPIVYGAIYCRITPDILCQLYDISTNETHPFFQPYSYEESYITRYVGAISFDNSTVRLLTTQICRAFPYLWSFDLKNSSLNRIEDGALLACTKLQRFNISGNNVTELNLNLFVSNPNLERIDVSYNKLTQIDMKIFESTKNLKFLYLNNNFLFQLDVVGMPKLERLEQLHLDYNNFLDLNEDALVERCPNLENITLKGNSFECRNLESIVKVFHARNITVDHRGPHDYTVSESKCLDRRPHYSLFVDAMMKIQKVKQIHVQLGQILSEYHPRNKTFQPEESKLMIYYL